MDIDKQVLLLLLPIFLRGFNNVAASIGHGPSLLPAPLVVGWTKYVPQAVPPHAWTSTYLNTGVRVLPAPPYYAPAYPHPVPVPYPAQPLIPATPIPTLNAATPLVPTPTFNSAPPPPLTPAFNPTTPLFPTPTFNSAPLPTPTFNSPRPFLPTPAFNSPRPFLPTPAFSYAPSFPTPVFNSLPPFTPTPISPPPTFRGNPVFKSPYPVPFPRPVEPGPNSDPRVPASQPSGNLFASPGFQGNFASPYVSHPSVGGPPRPYPIRGSPPSYSVTELDPEDTYGPPPNPYVGKYLSAPSEKYGPPSRVDRFREHPNHPSVSHVVRIVARPSRYSEFFR
ncbi:unnamed protein product [Bemisia tabaci]|uniref:Uncharacterized protein n=1 Tax=Bemisia tabaci TaxID=7038 RepID=A0A9P0F0Z2_BEMTA|nr:unnamed protein product [Bemisia tabaci]